MEAKKFTYTYMEMLLFFICVYTIATLFNNKIPSIPLARIIGMFISAMMFIIMASQMTKKMFITFMLSVMPIIISFAVAGDYSTNFKDAVWFFTTVMSVCLGADRKFRDEFKSVIYRKRKTILYTVLICDLILCLAIVSPSSYGNAWSWGDSEGFFVGFAQNGHTLCSCCCLLLVLIMLIFQDEKMRMREYILYFPPLYGVFFSGARTFLIPVAVLLLSGVFIKVKNRKARLGITLVLIVAFVLFLQNSSMMDKINFASNNKYATNVLSSITNGRSEFWNYDLRTFSQFNILGWLFGKGFDYIYRLNQRAYGLAIYAHNDLINFLVCLGLFGTVTYFSNWIRFTFRTQTETYSGYKLELSTKILFALYVWAPMLLNGMFAYQHYVYSCVLLSIYYYGFHENP